MSRLQNPREPNTLMVSVISHYYLQPFIKCIPCQPPPPAGGLLFSPFKDLSINMDWITYEIGTQVGCANCTWNSKPILNSIPPAMSSLTWAFVSGECGSKTENWSGISPAQVATNIPLWVAAGKRYIISTGGENAVFTCGSDAGFLRFIANYHSDNMLGVDFDVEGPQNQTVLDNLVQRIKYARTVYPAMRFSFTVATLGGSEAGDMLGTKGKEVMATIVAAGLSWDNLYINMMAMDYGMASAFICEVGSSGLCNMGQSAINAAERLHSTWGVPYTNIGLTPMIGGNDQATNIFSIKDAATLTAYARRTGLGFIGYWSFDRDTDCLPNKQGANALCNSYGTAGTLGFAQAFLKGLGQQ